MKPTIGVVYFKYAFTCISVPAQVHSVPAQVHAYLFQPKYMYIFSSSGKICQRLILELFYGRVSCMLSNFRVYKMVTILVTWQTRFLLLSFFLTSKRDLALGRSRSDVMGYSKSEQVLSQRSAYINSHNCRKIQTIWICILDITWENFTSEKASVVNVPTWTGCCQRSQNKHS